MAETLSDLRRRAWKTHRAKYGAAGHAGSYSRGSAPCWACERMTKLIIGLHADGTLSEGQAVKATGLGRVEFRRRADELAETGESLNRLLASAEPTVSRQGNLLMLDCPDGTITDEIFNVLEAACYSSPNRSSLAALEGGEQP